jgi:hypothetical protein
VTPKHHERCKVCRRSLPLPTPDEALRGGRPRQYCGRFCKYKAGRRARTVQFLRRWAQLVAARGDASRAEMFQQRAQAMADAAWHVGPR